VSVEGGFRRYLGLAAALAAREFPGAYRGNLTGALAAIFVPLAMLATYSFVFSTLIPVRIAADRSTGDYALFLFSGLVVWNLFADVAVRGPRLFVGSPNYVQRPHFPVSLLVLAPCLASFYRSLPWLAAYLVAHGVIVGSWSWTQLAAPLVLGAAALLTVGVTLCLASIGAVLRDTADLVPPAMTLLFFLSPILYPAAKLDAVAEWILLVNPAAAMIEAMRSLVFEQVVPSEAVALRLLGTVAGWFALGMLLYRGVRRALPDLI
jgi:lipopolysaccharide transport system permease protein